MTVRELIEALELMVEEQEVVAELADGECYSIYGVGTVRNAVDHDEVYTVLKIEE